MADATAVQRSLRTLHAHLKVGLNVGDYTSLVGDARAAYDLVEAPAGPCAQALAHYDSAITIHGDAASGWDTCIDEYPACFVDTVGLGADRGGVRLFAIYREWNKADAETAQGDQALVAIGP